MWDKKTNCFELRNHNIDTLLFVVKTNDMAALRDELVRRFDESSEFFTNEVVAIDLRCVDNFEQVPVSALTDFLKQHRMHPIGVVANDAQRQSVEQTGLPFLALSGGREAKPVDAASSTKIASTPQPASNATPGSTMIFDKPLRSGQQIYAQGDLVVLGPVNYGAEVMAIGNLYIYAPLRGRALAGVRGNQDARIFCTCVEAELISIAGIYQTAETSQLASIRGRSMQVRLVDEQLVMAPLQLT